jgi:uncharacterized protein (TIRG00374 family)
VNADRSKTRRIAGRFIGAAVAVALFAAVLMIARPAAVWHLLLTIDRRLLAVAALISAAFLAARGLRLRLLLEKGRLGWPRATLVAAAAQGAALFAPARTGELALPWLLKRTAGQDFSSAVGTLLAARTLDLATLGLWGGAAVLAVRGLTEPAALAISALLLVPIALLPITLAAADRIALRLLAPRGVAGRRWARRVRRVRRELEKLRERPARLLAAALVSAVMWGLQWGVVWVLLTAMGHRWPPATVVAGSVAAAVANLLPFNLVGNLGTLEAGWTAAFTALGVPLEVAATTGLAAHLWGLLFAAAFGALAWGMLSLSRKDGNVRTLNVKR